MPKTVSQSGLQSRLGAEGAKALERHRNDEINYGAGGDLPAGIEGGVADLVECKFDTYKKGENTGEYYFYAAAVVRSPSEFNGMIIEGQRTSIMEPICATPKRGRATVEDHLAWVINELHKLGVVFNETRPVVDQLEEVATALKQAAPSIRFRTWLGSATPAFPNPRVNHEWRGLATGPAVANDDGAGGVIDNSGDGGSDDTGDQNDSPVEDDGLDTLLEAANAADADAQNAITDRAKAAGAFDEVDSAPDWDTAVQIIREAEANGNGSTEAEAPEADAPQVPQKGEVYSYKPPKMRKPLDCEVTAVFEAKRLVNLKNLADGKTIYKSVPFAELK
jgi:hypothetical protein